MVSILCIFSILSIVLVLIFIIGLGSSRKMLEGRGMGGIS